MHERIKKAYCKDPVLSCALEGAANVLAGIKEISIVIHSPQGCAATVANAYDQHEVDFTNRKVGCTRLFERDIIMGATPKLEEVIREASKSFQSKVIFVIGTCAADIIGEHIEAVCKELQPEIEAKLIPVYAGGFRGNSYAGMDLALEALYPLIKNSNIKYKHLVNIIAPQANSNPTWWADLEWVKGILAELEIGINTVFSHETTLEAIENAAWAASSIVLSHEVGYKFAKQLEKEHGVKVILEDLPMPIGLKNTARWLRALGNYFKKEAQVEAIIKREEKKVIDVLRKRGLMMIPRYRNCKVGVCADLTIGVGLVRMLFEELEMIPECLILKANSPQGKKILEDELEDLKISPEVILEADGYQIKEAIKQANVEVMIGSAWEKYLCEEYGIKIEMDLLSPTNREVYINEPYFGYEGMLRILQVFANDWERAFRSKHISYKEM